jgi:tRNA A-37 threonylcarbamoyl transferase component Bud32
MGLCPRCLLQGALSRPSPTPPPAEPALTAGFVGASSAPAPADLAALFPQLEILELIGQGGMGAVYKARQPKLDRLVAIKILPAEWGRDPAFAERFAREARALARLNHPQIVAVHDFGEAGGFPFLIMEYVDGVNLRQLLQSGRLEPAQALAIVPQLCDALQYAHEEGIVHRDIKPENILLDRRGRVKIADFGLAKLTRRSVAEFTLTGSRQVMGTLDYMAPEQRTNPQDVDHRADIYALGVVLYEMLTGELPLGRFAPPSQRAEVDPRLDEVVFRALEREPGRRYQRISEVKTDVEAVARRQQPAAALRPRGSADLDLAFARLRLGGPAIGLILTAVAIAVQAVGLASYMLARELDELGRLDGRFLVFFWVLFVLGVGFVSVVIAVLISGARKMRRLESYDLGVAAALIAMVPFSYHVIIGIPFGIWTLWALSRRDVKEAFLRVARGQHVAAVQAPQATGFYGRVKSALGGMLTLIVHRPTAEQLGKLHQSEPHDLQAALPVADALPMAGPARVTPLPHARETDRPVPGRRPPWSRALVAVAAAILLVLASVIACFALLRATYFATYQGDDGPPAPASPLAFHRGSLTLYAHQQQQIDEILRTADEQYLKLESRHTRLGDSDEKEGRRVTVLPFKDELKQLEDRTWAQLESILDVAQSRQARQLLPIRGSLFPLGQEKVEMEFCRTEQGFGWRVLPEGDDGKPPFTYGQRLPREYQRFWPEAARKR